MRALVVSGGGSMGAYAGGVIEYLMETGLDWDIYTGTSTGSLITPMIACGEIDDLKKAYTSIKPGDIFSLNPFRFKSVRNGEFKFGINHINIMRNLIFRKSKSLGDASNLRETIKKFLTTDRFNKVRGLNREVIVSVCNLTFDSLEFKSILEEEYEDFVDWMWASSCAPPFMNVVEKDGYDYVDGGLLSFAPIREAIELGATEVDAIVLMEDMDKNKIEKVRNVLHLISKMLKIFMQTRKTEDLNLLKFQKVIKDGREVKLNIYFTPRKLTNNPYIFDYNTMNNWWEEGYNLSKMGPNKSYLITKKKSKLVG
jgi:predicted acylesterase/phospholipase RssA